MIKRFCKKSIIFFSIILLINGCAIISKTQSYKDSSLSELFKKMKDCKKDFYITGLEAFNDEFLLASGLGVIKVDKNFSFELFRWKVSDIYAIDSIFSIKSNNEIWVKDQGSSLLNYDGYKWVRKKEPKAKDHFVMADFEYGYTSNYNETDCWCESGGGGYLWKRDIKKESWQLIDIPLDEYQEVKVNGGHFFKYATLKNNPLYVYRYDVLIFLHEKKPTISDKIYMLNNKTNNIDPVLADFAFNVKSIVILHDRTFFSTIHGQFCEVTIDRIRKLETPSFCEAITRTSDDKIYGVFQNIGLCEFENNSSWKIIQSYPLPANEWNFKHMTFLQESNGIFCLAISPELIDEEHPIKGKSNFKYPHLPRIWLLNIKDQNNKPFKEVSVFDAFRVK